MEQLEQIKKYIAKYQDIHIFASPQHQAESSWAAWSLFYTLKHLGKNAMLINKNDLPSHNLPPDFHPKQTIPYKASMALAIKERGFKIKTLRYQKENDVLKFFLETEEGEISKENISLKSQPQEALLIAFNTASLDEIKPLYQRDYLAIDINNIENKHSFGQINLSCPAKTITEMVLEIIFEGYPEAKNHNPVLFCLLCGIIKETIEGAKKFNFAVSKKIELLRRQGLPFVLATNLLFPTKEQAPLRLVAFCLQKIEAQGQGAIIVISANDFLATESQPKDLALLFQKISAGFLPFQTIIVLWESGNKTLSGVLSSSQPILKTALKQSFPCKEKGVWTLFQTNETNIAIVREKIKAILNP